MPHRIVHLRKLIVLTCAFSVSAPLVQSVVPAGAITAHADSAALPKRGDHSSLVVRLQELLQKAGVRVAGGADGMFGPATAKSVATFQTAKGLPATGVVDLATATALGLVKATPQLAPGAAGAAVKTVQQRLQAWGVKVKGGADGLYGPATAKAVAQFQAARKLPSTGNVDAYTAAILAGQPAAAPAAAASGLPKPGTTGAAVKTVQKQLVAVGARPKGGVDGAYGPATKAAIALFQRWMGLPASGVLDTSTAKALATTAAKATGSSVTLASFPLPRTCAFGDTWGAARAGGRRHVGTDIFARRGTSVLAVADGRITRLTRDFPGSRGGNQFWLTAKDGTKYFYGHLDSFARGMGVGVPVRAGDTIGYAGKTGLTTVTHLHFEVHPGGGAPVNPYAILRRAAGC